jgi:hypothetical protein
VKRARLRSLRGLPILAFVAGLPLAAPNAPRTFAIEQPRKYAQILVRQFSPTEPAVPLEVLARFNAPRARAVRDSQGTRWRVTSQGLLELRPSGRKKLWIGKDGLPVAKLTTLSAAPDGRLWLGSSEGAICFAPREPANNRWFYFWGKRYLADNSVERIVAEPGGAWIRTRAGISRIEFKPFDLEQKSLLFIERVQQRHNRYGLVADCRLLRPGVPSSFRLVPNDNDGLWTALYVAAECYRYALTHSPEALWNARTSLAALIRLESITGISGFPARSWIHRGDYREPGGEWHWTADGEWEWKGDTSSDELVGHFFAYSVAYELLPEETDRVVIRPVVARIAGHLVEHDWQLVGYGGRVTRWGDFSPEYFRTPEGEKEAPLSSLELLSHLRVAYHVTGEERFLEAYRRVIEELGYLRNVARFATETPEEVNYSDEELAFLSFYPLVRLEEDPHLRHEYQRALRALWQRVRAERNPLWNLIYAVGTGAEDYAREDALATLERIPLDTISWTVKNSQRADLEMNHSRGRVGEKQSWQAIPANERRVMKWNGNPFELDGGDDGRSEDDGTFFLLPYWLGRYHGLLGP